MGSRISAILQAYRLDRAGFITAGIIIALLLLFPLAGISRGYTDFTESKYTAFVLTALIYLAALAYVFASGWRRGQICIHLPRSLSVSQKLLLLFALLAFLSAIFSPYQELVWQGSARKEGLVTIGLYLALFMGMSAFGSFRPLYPYLLLLPLLVNIILALMQLAGANPLELFPAGLNYYDGNYKYSSQFLGTIGNTGLLTAFFCLAIPVLLGYVLKWQSDRKRWLLAVPILPLLYLIVAAHVLAGLVGLACCLAAIVFLLLPGRIWRIIYLALLVLLLIAVLIFLYAAYSPQGSGFGQEIAAMLHGDFADSFGSGRIQIWRESLALVPKRPLLGGGPDTLGARLQLIFTADGDSVIPRQTKVDIAHNDYLNIMVNLGIPALIVYLAALAVSARNWWRYRQQPAVFLLGAAVFCYSVQIFFSFSSSIVSPLFWLLWGMFDYQCKQAKKQDISPGE